MVDNLKKLAPRQVHGLPVATIAIGQDSKR